MPRGYRSVILATVGCLALGASHPPPQDADSGYSAAKRQPAPPPPTAPADTPYAPYPDWHAEACYQAKPHDTADLCAQWRAAIAGEEAAHEARRATDWAIVGTILSGLALAGLGYTLWQTQSSLGQAKRSNLLAMKANARATRQAVSGAKDTERALAAAERHAAAAERNITVLNRPYVLMVIEDHDFPKEVIYEDKFSFDAGDSRFEVLIRFHNYGKSPAVIEWPKYRLAVLNLAIARFYKPKNWFLERTGNGPFPTIIAANSSTDYIRMRLASGISPQNAKDFSKIVCQSGEVPEGELTCWGGCFYQDIAGNRWVSYVSYTYGIGGGFLMEERGDYECPQEPNS